MKASVSRACHLLLFVFCLARAAVAAEPPAAGTEAARVPGGLESTAPVAFMQGTYTISLSPTGAGSITVAGIENTTADTRSGPVGFELWFSKEPYQGGPISGYPVATVLLPMQGCGAARLDPDQTCVSLSFDAPLALPADGAYYPVLFLVEYSTVCPGTRQHYCIDDYVNLIELTTAAPTVTVGSSLADKRSRSMQTAGSNFGHAAFNGNAVVTYDWSDSRVDIAVDGVVSTAPGATTGSLQFELWFLTQQYVRGEPNSGFRVASFALPAKCSSGSSQLTAGGSCAAIDSGMLPLSLPAPGKYYTVLYLTEYSSSCTGNGGYCIDDALVESYVDTTTVPAAGSGGGGASDGGGGGGSFDAVTLMLLSVVLLIPASRRFFRADRSRRTNITGGAAVATVAVHLAGCGSGLNSSNDAVSRPVPPESTTGLPPIEGEKSTAYGYIPLDGLAVQEVQSPESCNPWTADGSAGGGDPYMQLFKSLPDVTVRFAVAAFDASGGLSFGPATVTAKGRNYQAVLDYVNVDAVPVTMLVSATLDGRPIPLSYAITLASGRGPVTVPPAAQGASVTYLVARPGAVRFTARAYEAAALSTGADPSDQDGGELLTIPVYVGIGMRLTANIKAEQAGVALTGLTAIGFEAQAGKLSGTLSMQTIGISGPGVTGTVPLSDALDQTTISNATAAIHSIRAVVYSTSHQSDIVITPRVVGIFSPIASTPDLINAIYSELSRNPPKWKRSCVSPGPAG